MGPDLIYDRSLRALPSADGDVAGSVVFSPMLFRKHDLSQPLSECEIPLPSLLGLGEIATTAKRRFVDAACDQAPMVPSALLRDQERVPSEEVGGQRGEALVSLELKRRY